MSDRYVCINIIYLLMALCLIFDIVYIISKAKKKNIIGLIGKVLAALCFIVIGYFGYLDNPTTYRYFILLGLLLDGIGDLFLGLRNLFAKNVMFLLGTLSFLAGHVMFIRALLLLENANLVLWLVAGVLEEALIFYLFNRVCRFHKIYYIVGIAYACLIMIMANLAIGVYMTSNLLSDYIFMIGAGLFVASDIILVLYNFSKKDKWMHPVYSLLYFIAQILISFSLHI